MFCRSNSDKLTCSDVPELDGSIVTAGDDKLVVELETSDGGLMLVRAGECLETLAGQDVPNLDSGVSIARD